MVVESRLNHLGDEKRGHFTTIVYKICFYTIAPNTKFPFFWFGALWSINYNLRAVWFGNKL